MMLQGQLGQPQQAPMPIEMPAPNWAIANTGLLGNDYIQVHFSQPSPDAFIAAYRRLLDSVQANFKLSLYKRQKFTPEGRQERIAASLAALDASQPTELSLTQWKEIVEEIEDEE